MMWNIDEFLAETADIPGDALYVRYNEFGGITRSHLMDDIRRLAGQNGWKVEYDREADSFFCFRLGDRSAGHTLNRRK